jgi:hypothetical protein
MYPGRSPTSLHCLEWRVLWVGFETLVNVLSTAWQAPDDTVGLCNYTERNRTERRIIRIQAVRKYLVVKISLVSDQSSGGRQINHLDGHVLYVQTGADINRGNSGGPLLEIKRNLLGSTLA